MAHSEMDDGWEEQLRPSGLGEYDGAQDEPSSSLSEDSEDDFVPVLSEKRKRKRRRNESILLFRVC